MSGKIVKTRAWGQCGSDSRNLERLTGGVTFISFLKPRQSLEKGLKRVNARGRPHHQLTAKKMNGNKHLSTSASRQVNVFRFMIYGLLGYLSAQWRICDDIR